MAQKLARHSDVNLTLGTYTHLQAKELAQAVEGLPSLVSDERASGPKCDPDSPPVDPDLQRVILSWPSLSVEVRKRIVATLEEG